MKRIIQVRRAKQAGFTLIEVLVSLAVLGMIVVGLSQGTRFGLAAWNRQIEIAGASANLDAIDRTLRSLLTQAAAGRRPGGRAEGGVAPAGQDDPGFVGSVDRMAFRSVLPEAVGASGRDARVTIWREEDGRLMLGWTPRLADAATERRAVREIVLLDRVQRVAFSYWDDGRAGGTPGWRDVWRSPIAPALVRVHFDFDKGDRREWPDIIVTPMLGGRM